MSLEELHAWLVSTDGMGDEISKLRRFAAVEALSDTSLVPTQDLRDYRPDWPRLLLAASILGMSPHSNHLDPALTIAQAAMQWGPPGAVRDAGGVILSQLANHRALALAVRREKLAGNLDERLGVSEKLNQARRELQQTIFLHPQAASSRVTSLEIGAPGERRMTANVFQRKLWDALAESRWVSATAPTAAGKTYIVLQWLMERFAAGDAQFAIFIAPTRALGSGLN